MYSLCAVLCYIKKADESSVFFDAAEGPQVFSSRSRKEDALEDCILFSYLGSFWTDTTVLTD